MAETLADVIAAREAYATANAGASLYNKDTRDDSTAAPVGVVFADSPYTVAAGTGLVTVNATGGAVVVNLTKAAANKGRVLTVKKTDVSANTVTVDGDGTETIDGATTVVLSAQYASTTIVSDGTAWHVI